MDVRLTHIADVPSCLHEQCVNTDSGFLLWRHKLSLEFILVNCQSLPLGSEQKLLKQRLLRVKLPQSVLRHAVIFFVPAAEHSLQTGLRVFGNFLQLIARLWADSQ